MRYGATVRKPAGDLPSWMPTMSAHAPASWSAIHIRRTDGTLSSHTSRGLKVQTFIDTSLSRNVSDPTKHAARVAWNCASAASGSG